MKKHSEALAPARRSGPLETWFNLHLQNGVSSLTRLGHQPFASLLTILVIGITLALPATMHLIVKNATSLSRNWDNALDFSIYLRDDVSEDDAGRMAEIIGQRADVERVTVIPADDALAQFRDQSGFGPALDYLTDNPLPHTLVVRPSAANTEQSMLLLSEELGNLPEADFVQVDTEWVQRFLAILDMLRQAVLIGAVLLGVAIVVIIGNTIRLDIQNRREEIEVTKLIGASNAFVRRPFLYSGFWYGLGGGLLALGLVAYGLHAFREPAARLAGLYGSSFSPLSLDIRESGLILTVSVLLGLFGSWLAATRHMRQIEPR